MCASQSLASGLQDLLDYEGDVESEMMCNFTIGYTDMFGSSLTKELKENGAEITVTNENRQVHHYGCINEREVIFTEEYLTISLKNGI